MAKKKVHIVSYTHWDREFRFDFETTRMWLVRLWDNLLEIMQKKTNYKHFMLDGQFILVDDYLEIRPEKTDEIKKLVKSGRLQVGPWYSLPDSSSVNGESLIRNLMTGIKKSEEFGNCMKVGYNIFSFGQISQLPQFYAGFDIDMIMFYKHMARNRSKYDEFIWQGPDGTKAFATRLGREARWNFFFAGHIPIVYDKDPWHKDWQYKWGTMGKTFHFCEPDTYAGFHFITDPETSFHAKNIREGFQRTFDTLKQTAVPEHLLFFDGTDFTEAHPLIPEIIQEAKKVFGSEYEIEHTTLEEYFKAIKPLLKKREIETVTGHMKDGPAGSIHTDVVSVHPELKRANSLAENMLYKMAEPFATVAWMNGATYPKTNIERILMQIFKSQAHDSLHGVGPKDLSDGVEYRLVNAKIIGQNIAAEALQKISENINTASISDSDLFITVFNSAAFKRNDVVEAYIDVPIDWPVEELILEDMDGNQLDIFELEKVSARAGLYHPRSRNMPMYINRYRVLFYVKNVGGLGYKTLKVKCKKQNQYPYPHEDFDAVKVPFAPLAKNPRQAENEFIAVTICGDGTLEITNKTNGKVYRKLHYFTDEGQAGNHYRCCPPKINKVVTTLGEPANISLVINNELMAKFVIETQMSVPKFYDKHNNCRSSEEVTIPIKSTVTLKKDSPIVEIETTVENKAKDHFLRVCFETGLKADYTYASEVFNTEPHAAKPSQDGKWQGPELRRHQQHMFMAIGDSKDGMAILNDTLRDYEVTDYTSGTIAQSVVRSVELRIPCDNRLWMEYPNDDSTQSLRTIKTRYAIMPYRGSWEKAGVYQEAFTFGVPLRLAQIAKNKGTLEPDKSFLEIEDENLVFSAFKKCEAGDTIIFRAYNPTNAAVSSKVKFGFDVKKVYQSQLNEKRSAALPIAKNTLNVKLGPKKVVTFEIVI